MRCCVSSPSLSRFEKCVVLQKLIAAVQNLVSDDINSSMWHDFIVVQWVVWGCAIQILQFLIKNKRITGTAVAPNSAGAGIRL